MPNRLSLIDEKAEQEFARLTEESRKAYERRYTVLFWGIMAITGMLSLLVIESVHISAWLLLLVMIMLLMWLDFRIGKQILLLETYRRVFYETNTRTKNHFRKTAKVKYWALEEGQMNPLQKVFHYLLDHTEFQFVYSLILILFLVMAGIRVPKEYITLLIVASCAVMFSISYTLIQHFHLNSRRRTMEEIWQRVREEIKQGNQNTE